MAKISAHGSTKVAERSFDVIEDGNRTRVHFVLRSDGTLLKAFSWPLASTPYGRKRGQYNIQGRLPVATIAEGTQAQVDYLDAFIDRKVALVNARQNGQRAVRSS